MTWVGAEGCRVVDGDGPRLADLSGGYGVAALGHRNPEVGEALGELIGATPPLLTIGDEAIDEALELLA